MNSAVGHDIEEANQVAVYPSGDPPETVAIEPLLPRVCRVWRVDCEGSIVNVLYF